MGTRDRPLRVYIIAGEASGDVLGGAFLESLKQHHDGEIEIAGIGGERMAAEGVSSLFPMEELSLIGLSAILRRLPALLGRLRQTRQAVLAFEPDLLLVIDSPEFTQRVAKAVRRQRPDLLIIKWVSPTVWAWRPGRAAEMTAYIDHLLALFPFEPDVHRRLGGPPCTYIGHPLIETDMARDPAGLDRRPADPEAPLDILLLPGSRRAEITRFMPVFRKTVDHLASLGIQPRLSLVVAPRRRALIEDALSSWPVPVTLRTADDKAEAYRTAHVALAVSGTVTLEIALAGLPMVVVYRLDGAESILARFMLRLWTIVLPNYVLGRQAVREFVGDMVRPELIGHGLTTLAYDTPERRAQLASFAELREQALSVRGQSTPVGPYRQQTRVPPVCRAHNSAKQSSTV
ncbi:MAG: lipid-A-disaccharide synthase, partial [Pseudomonadota bacterium]